jgi:hypothetical protein
MSLLFLLLKHDNYFTLWDSRFSEQISCLSFPEFVTGFDGLNPFVLDSLWARNIRSVVVDPVATDKLGKSGWLLLWRA